MNRFREIRELGGDVIAEVAKVMNKSASVEAEPALLAAGARGGALNASPQFLIHRLQIRANIQTEKQGQDSEFDPSGRENYVRAKLICKWEIIAYFGSNSFIIAGHIIKELTGQKRIYPTLTQIEVEASPFKMKRLT